MRDRNGPGRPREFDDTEKLRTIMSLFWKHGFEGVSLSQIMTETGLQKASLYAAFGDKRTMYLKALQQYHQDVVANAAAALKDERVAPEARLEAFLTAPLMAAEADDRTGCFLCNASADQADLDGAVKAQVRRGFDHLSAAVSATLAQLHPDLNESDRAAQAQIILTLYSGFRIQVRSGSDVAPMKAAVAYALRKL